jgi:hypothetical protein
MDFLSELQVVLFVFFILQIKHFIADFMFQTDRMVAEKGIYGARYGIYHSLIQSAGTFLAFCWIHPAIGVITAFLDFLAHYHIDWAKININKKYNYTPADRKFWFWLGLDQLAHQLTYIILVGWVFFAF